MVKFSTEVAPSFIHCIAFDAYGRHLALATSEHCVKIFIRVDTLGNEWKEIASFSDHTAGVHGVSWVHPRRGCLLASCSSDRTIRFYHNPSYQTAVPQAWEALRVKISDPKADAFIQIEFSPAHIVPIKLAACNGDGTVRIYEYDAHQEAWVELSRFHPTQSTFYKDSSTIGNIYSTISGTVNRSATSVAWMSRLTSSHLCLIVGSHDGSISIWKSKTLSHSKFDCCKFIPSCWSTTSAICDIEVAPCLGRGYYSVAICSKEALCLLCVMDVSDTGSLEVVPVSIIDRTSILTCRSGDAPPVEWHMPGEYFCGLSFDTSGTQLAVITSHQRIRILRRDMTHVDSAMARQQWTLVGDKHTGPLTVG